jgi:hypothetical protein
LFRALLLGAGVLGGGAWLALAGDKIQFSSSSDTLALPTVERPQDDPADFSLHVNQPKPAFYRGFAGYFPQQSVIIVPSRRNDNRDRRNGDSAPSGNSRQDRSSSDRDAYQDSAYNSATNQSWSMENGWISDSAAGLGRGSEDSGSQYGAANARRDPLNPYGKHDSLSGSGFSSVEKDWTRPDDASSARAVDSDQSYFSDLVNKLRPRQKQSWNMFSGYRPGSQTSRFPDAFGSSVAPVVAPSATPAASPLDSAGYVNNNNYYNQAGAAGAYSAYGKTLGRPEEGNGDAMPGLRAWDPQSSAPQPGQPNSKPQPPPPSQGQTSQGHPATLPWAKRLGSVFNN